MYHRPCRNVTVPALAPTVLNSALSMPGLPAPASTIEFSLSRAHAGYVSRRNPYVDCCVASGAVPPPVYVQSSTPSSRSPSVRVSCAATSVEVAPAHFVTSYLYSVPAVAPGASLQATVMWFWRMLSPQISSGGGCGTAVEAGISVHALRSAAPPPTGVRTVRTRM